MLKELFGTSKPVIGMVHLPALPGSPMGTKSLDEIVEFALADARSLQAGGAHALIVENQFDQPFVTGSVSPLTVAVMTAVACEVRKVVTIPMGVNVLFNDWQAELAVAAAAGAQFMRVEVLVDSCWSDMGFLPACAPDLLRARASSPVKPAILADIQGKYTSLAVPKTLADSAADAEARGLADAVIVTGTGTGHSATIDDLRVVKEKIKIPVLAGSGITAENVREVFGVVDGAIIGSYFKQDGRLANPVDANRVRNLIGRL